MLILCLLRQFFLSSADNEEVEYPVHFMSPLRLHTVEIYSADFLFLFSPKSENLKQWQQVKDHVVRDGKLRPNCSFKNKGFI